MSKWSDEFNKLPRDVRHISAMCDLELRIQHLNLEKKRLKKYYQASLREINEHIKNCKNALQRETTNDPKIAEVAE